MAQHWPQLCVLASWRVLQRYTRSYEAHTKFVGRALCGSVTRLIIFVVLALAFGLLFNDLDWTSDRAGVNSLNAYVARCRCAAVAG